MVRGSFEMTTRVFGSTLAEVGSSVMLELTARTRGSQRSVLDARPVSQCLHSLDGSDGRAV